MLQIGERADTASIIGPVDLPPPSRAYEHLKSKLAAAPKVTGSANAKVAKILRKALHALKAHNYTDCCKGALEALDIDENHPQANHILAISLERLGQLEQAVKVFERALALDPSDGEIYFNLGLLAWRLKSLKSAERLFRIYIEKEPARPDGYNNLAGILRDDGRFEDAIEILRGALFQMPEAAQLWNSLGTVVMETGQMREARTFLEEAVRLAPDMGRAHHNLGYLLAHVAPADEALAAYDKALTFDVSPQDRTEMLHARAISLFHAQRLEDAFREWEVRFDPNYKDAPLYGLTCPRWRGEPLQGRKILLIAEQGLGDEIMFAHAIPDLIAEVGPEGRVAIACEKRLVSLFSRSFPDAIVGPYVDSKLKGRIVRRVPWTDKVGEINCFSPFGSTLLYKRRRIEDFAGRPPFLRPDPARVDQWRERITALGPPPYVGLTWKSLVMTGKRAKFYSPIEHWGPVLTTPGATFINMQYGECKADIALAEKKFGAKIHYFDDFDYKMDLDGNAALAAALDVMITAPNAASAIAGAAGLEVWFITLCEVWPQLGTDRMPWYQRSRVFVPNTYGNFADGLARAGKALGDLVAERSCAAA